MSNFFFKYSIFNNWRNQMMESKKVEIGFLLSYLGLVRICLTEVEINYMLTTIWIKLSKKLLSYVFHLFTVCSWQLIHYLIRYNTKLYVYALHCYGVFSCWSQTFAKRRLCSSSVTNKPPRKLRLNQNKGYSLNKNWIEFNKY